MKRSEIINIIVEAMRNQGIIESEDPFESHEAPHLASDILTALEEHGMLPPIHEDIPDDDQEYIGYAMGEFHNWEKEDEEK